MTGLLYKLIRTNWVKILLFFLGSLFYPFMFALIFRSDDMKDDLTSGISIMLWAFMAFMAFLIGGFCEDSIFNDDERKKWAYFVASTPTGIKGQIGAKYLFTLCYSMLTVTALILCCGFARDGSRELADGSVIFIGFFYIQLTMRAIEFPLMARFGSKIGKSMKIIIIGIAAFIFFAYMLFGDTSAFADMDTFFDRLLAALADENKVKRMTLWFSIITLAVIPIYYLSYRLAVKWYMKGVESYAK